MGRRQVSTAATAAFLVALCTAGAPPSYASCASDSGPSGAPVIFVGTADAERRGFTRFSVSEVWAGPDLAHEVWVLSGQRQPRWPLNLLTSVGSSVDAEFVDGDRYVVGASQRFQTSACVIRELPSDRTRAPGRPASVREPTPDGSTGASPPIGPLGQGLWVAGVVATIGSASALRRRRRRAHAPNA